MDSMRKGSDLKEIISDLNSMGKELDKIQNEMTEHLALRVALLERIMELVKSDEREIVLEKTERLRVRERKSVVK